MDMQGQRTLPMAREVVWDAINDPGILKACIPGCEKFEPDGDNAYQFTTALKIGPVAARFSGRVQLTDIAAPQSCRLQFEAQGGAAGFGKGESAVELVPVDAGCELRYSVHSSVGGKIAQLGQRLIDGVAKSMAEEFFRRFEAELLRRHAPAEALAGAPAAATPAPARAGDGLPAWAWGLITFIITFVILLGLELS